jgi:predicted amidophosphoribosyltransferase
MPSLLQIDDLVRGDHSWLTEDDDCYYFMEYTAHEGYGYSAANQFIFNYKKPVRYKGTPAWGYKETAISNAAKLFREYWPTNLPLNTCTFVPVPPSKIKTHKEYDDRILRTINLINPAQCEVKELLSFQKDMEPAHIAQRRPTVQELMANIIFDGENEDSRDNIILFDDVITTGCHFKACKNILQEYYPNANIIGMFIARRVPQVIDWPDFDAEEG